MSMAATSMHMGARRQLAQVVVPPALRQVLEYQPPQGGESAYG
jgi:hypothetical protein